MVSYGCDTVHCAHCSDQVRGLTLGCLGTRSLPFTHPSPVLWDVPSLALLLCIAAPSSRAPSPLLGAAALKGRRRTLLVLEDLGEGLTDERGGTY